MGLMKNEFNKASGSNSNNSGASNSVNPVPVVVVEDRRNLGEISMSPEPSTAAIASEIDFLEKMFTIQFGLLSLVLLVMLFVIAKFSGATQAINSDYHIYTWIALGVLFLFLVKMERKTHKMINGVHKDISELKKLLQESKKQQ